MPVFFITDILFFVLLGVAVAYFFYARKHTHLLRPWRKLLQRRTATIALTIVLFYVLVTLLDSMHYKPALEPARQANAKEVVYSNEVLSALDWLLTPLRQQQEKTYSSPFAMHGYVKESVSDGDKNIRGYPRLKYGGRHLQHADERAMDILQRVVQGTAQGIFVFLVLICLWMLAQFVLKKKALAAQWSRFFSPAVAPIRAGVFTLLGLIVLGMICYKLAPAYHILGTDKVGGDVFYQAIKSIRTGVLIGTLTTLIMLPFALLLGITAGYFLGKLDDIIQYIYTTLNSIPGVLLIAAAVLMLHLYMDRHEELFDNLVVRADIRLLFLCAILGVTSWTGLCRLLRAETLKIKSMDYIMASRALGVERMKIIFRHVLPNVMHIVFITIALDFSGLVLAEAVLSYVNIGVDPTMHSWGNMINGARLEMAREPVVWWSLFGAFLFMFILVLCANLFADSLRDAFDPRTVLRQTS